MNSGFLVAPYLLGGPDPGFRGLSYGIHSLLSSNKPVKIYGTDFEDCYRGIYIAQGAAVEISSNHFYLGNLPDPSLSDRQFGTVFFASTKFVYQGNQFFGAAGNVEKTVGTCINASGDLNNRVFHNFYDALAIGNVANGENAGVTNGVMRGLQYHCNDNLNNSDFDFTLPNSGDVIRPLQGEVIGSSKLATGNKFSHVAPFSESDFSNHGGQSTDYYHINSNPHIPDSEREVPLYYFGIAPVWQQVNPNPDCDLSPEEPLPPLNGIALQEEKSRYYAVKAAFLQALAGYENALLAGNQTLATDYARQATYRRYQMDRSAHEVLRSLENDAESEQRDSIRQWLRHLETFTADLFLVLDYLEYGDSAQAWAAYEAIPGRFTLTAAQEEDYTAFETIVTLLSAQSMYTLDLNARESLLDLAQNDVGFSTQTAKGLLSYYGYHFFATACSLPECCGEAREGEDLLSAGESPQLLIWPNPASQQVFFDCASCSEKTKGLIVVYNLSGRPIWQSTLTTSQTPAVWSVGQTSPSLYFCQLSIEGKPVSFQKISIIR